METPEGGWASLRRELSRRTKRPLGHATFGIYFFGAIFLFGGLGIWVELLNLTRAQVVELVPLRTAIATFFLAIIGSACFQLILGKTLKQIKAAAYVGSAIVAAVGVWLIFDRSLSSWIAMPVGGLGYLLSLWVWWITNADNQDFYDDPPDHASLGGDVGRKLDGSLKGFKT